MIESVVLFEISFTPGHSHFLLLPSTSLPTLVRKLGLENTMTFADNRIMTFGGTVLVSKYVIEIEFRCGEQLGWFKIEAIVDPSPARLMIIGQDFFL